MRVRSRFALYGDGIFEGIRAYNGRVFKLKEQVEAQRSWNVVHNAIDVFQSQGWSERRNKLKTLRDALRGGPAEADWFLKKFGLAGKLPELKHYPQFAQTGWWDRWCGYFDATELSDWFVPL